MDHHKVEVLTSEKVGSLEQFRPLGSDTNWLLVASGYWSEDPYHSGFISYYLANVGGVWIMDAVQRNGMLDGVTEEDVIEGRLNDDQLQALWGTTLEKAQNEEYLQIVAICKNAPASITTPEVAKLIYEQVCNDGGMRIDEFVEDGLIAS